MGAGDNRQVRPRRADRKQIGGGGRAAFAPARAAVELGDLVKTRPLVLAGVEVGDLAVLAGRRRLDEGAGDRAGVLLVRHLQRAVAAVEAVGPVLVGLGPQEVGQAIVPRPAVAAKIGPAVIVAAMPAHIQHRVDGARPAQRLAARLKAAPPVQPGLRNGAIGPVAQLAAPRHQPDRAHRRADQDMVAAAPRFQQADLNRRILAEPRGERRARRSAPRDHIVERRP